VHVFATTEIAAALLQAAITLGLAGLFLFLFLRHGKPHFGWWAVAWALYALRLGAIIAFLSSDTWAWLFWHQVATGWTALGLLWAALVFSRQAVWRPAYALLLLFPPVWSYIAIFRLSHFMLAAGPAVAFLSLTTLWTGVIFWRYRSRTGSAAAGMLAATFLLWAVHHLDYPLLRARGAWNPWGYYLDILFLLAIGAGVLLLVIEEFRQGLVTLTALSGDLRRHDRADHLDALLRRPLTLRGVQGSALVRQGPAGPEVVRGVGACAAWGGQAIPAGVREQVETGLRSQRPVLRGEPLGGSAPPFVAVLPLGSGIESRVALVVVGEVAAPFTALDDGILVAVGAQIGAALETAELYRTLEQRTGDLERLSVRMIQQHEEQRGRLARELHDETAQVFSALKLQLGTLQEAAPRELDARFDRLLDLVNAGTRSIRSVTEDLRPALLDDLGLLPALRALVTDFRQWSGLDVRFEAPDRLASLRPEAELALFRAVQEGLSNAARHAQAGRVAVRVAHTDGRIRLTVSDDGVGLGAAELARVTSGPGRSGLFGMRERLVALGGRVDVRSTPGHGLQLDVDLPVPEETP
jgi:signal transduction histidine kinase